MSDAAITVPEVQSPEVQSPEVQSPDSPLVFVNSKFLSTVPVVLNMTYDENGTQALTFTDPSGNIFFTINRGAGNTNSTWSAEVSRSVCDSNGEMAAIMTKGGIWNGAIEYEVKTPEGDKVGNIRYAIQSSTTKMTFTNKHNGESRQIVAFLPGLDTKTEAVLKPLPGKLEQFNIIGINRLVIHVAANVDLLMAAMFLAVVHDARYVDMHNKELAKYGQRRIARGAAIVGADVALVCCSMM